ncbi:MAG: family 1 glycosylhydrolase [Bifidobacteriaceae bacterium]|jgi:beta-glucosidase|nr:family 1 glycosylhydrolase [Bifidobacteriaceae bacterium]
MPSNHPFPPAFLWGAATSAHQIEGNNTASDWWQIEHQPSSFITEPSGDACDSYHRWREDLELAADAGLNSYRFSIEWARLEPAPGAFSRANLAYYAKLIDTAAELGLKPLVTLHHFTNPAWVGALGSWAHPKIADLFARYCAYVAPILGQVEHICLINEPNMVTLFPVIASAGGLAALDSLPLPDPDHVKGIIAAHDAARAALRQVLPHARLGWSVASQTYHPEPGAEELAAAYQRASEDIFYDAAAGDDWIGVQSYTCRRVKAVAGELRAAPRAGSERTLTDWEYYPPALAECVRRVADLTGLPVLVTENGIATPDDARRIAYTAEALAGLAGALADGIDVRGYFHWSLLDNYEWGSFAPTFGLVAVDRTTFTRTPKPSLAYLGALARTGQLTTSKRPS